MGAAGGDRRVPGIRDQRQFAPGGTSENRELADFRKSEDGRYYARVRPGWGPHRRGRLCHIRDGRAILPGHPPQARYRLAPGAYR